jgi:NAD+ diphosphatase
MQYIANLNRRGEIRDQDSMIAELIEKEDSKVLLAHKGRFFFSDNTPVHISPKNVKARLTKQEASSFPAGIIYLGEYQNLHYFVYPIITLIAELQDQPLVDLRSASLSSQAFDLECLFYAQGLLNWHHSHVYCAKCGHQTSPSFSGHSRRCLNKECNKEHFPRIEPAVIFSIEYNFDGVKRILLARQKQWPDKRYSVLAGFAEHGESLELAVKREAYEEAGIEVEDATYISSQPWPFPASLMVGFHCTAKTSAVELLDKELESAEWYSANELENALTDGSLLMPFSVSISWQIIDRWFTQQTGYSIKTLNIE